MEFGTEYDFDVLARHRREIQDEIARDMLAAEVRKATRPAGTDGRSRIERSRGWFGRGWRRDSLPSSGGRAQA